MDLYSSIFEMIDMRSFTNLWYWIALAVTWSTASHWVIGVPFDMIRRAAREGGRAEADLADLVRINLDRIFHLMQQSGPWLTGFGTLILTLLAVTGFVYDVEFAQAVFLIAFPMTMIGALNLRTGARIRREDARGARLQRLLARHRAMTQGIGIVSIFVTTVYGLGKTVLITGSW